MFVAPPAIQPVPYVKLEPVPPKPLDAPDARLIGIAPFPVQTLRRDAIRIDLYAATGSPVGSRNSVLIARA